VTALRRLVYPLCVALLWPLNQLFSILLRARYAPGSVLHISYMGHIPHQTVRVLRDNGIAADYLAVGESPVWAQSDHQINNTGSPLFTPFREFALVWRVVSRYEIIHAHFMVTATRSGWEVPLLKRMGRTWVAHFRGCEVRDREQNMAMHPAVNICQECDYDPLPCKAPHNIARRALAARHADATLVTTPDLKDFAPHAEHMPFFLPPDVEVAPAPSAGSRPFVIVHATNHPGIEGTRHIREAIDRLRSKGYRIEFRFLSGARHRDVLDALTTADLAIGKLKMGYYANAQIESMAAGVPTVTCVREQFMTPELRESGFIFTSLDRLEATLEYYLANPDALAAKRALARSTISALHDNRALSRRYRDVYDRARAGQRTAAPQAGAGA
jgi:hypothetical protein